MIQRAKASPIPHSSNSFRYTYSLTIIIYVKCVGQSVGRNAKALGWKRLIIWCSELWMYISYSVILFSVCIRRGTQWMWLAARLLQKLDMFSEFWDTHKPRSEPVLPVTTGFALWMERVVMRGVINAAKKEKKLGQYCRLCAAANLILWITCASLVGAIWSLCINASTLQWILKTSSEQDSVRISVSWAALL